MDNDLPDSFDVASDGFPPPTIEAYFITLLRNLRTARGLSQARLGQLMTYSDGQIGMVESGRRRPTEEFAKQCDQFFGTVSAFTDLIPMMTWQALPSWLRAFAALEAQATAIRTCEVQVVPGLLQTPEYARAVMRCEWPRPSDDDIDKWVAARLDRQKILDRHDPPVITALLAESVLRTPIGGAEVMTRQLDHLIRLAMRPKIRIHVLTYEQTARCHLDGPFILLELPKKKRFVFVQALGAGILLRDQLVLDSYGNRLQSILGEALSWRESAGFIERLKKELYGSDGSPVVEEQP